MTLIQTVMTLIQTIDCIFEEKIPHMQIKLFSEGSNSDNFVFIVDEEREDQNIIKVCHHWPTSEAPFKLLAKRHLGEPMMAEHQECWLGSFVISKGDQYR